MIQDGKPEVQDVSVLPSSDAYAIGRIGSIARSGLTGRQKASVLREVAGREGWLEASSVMPDDVTLAQVLQVRSSRPRSVSSLIPYLGKFTTWCV